MTGFQVLPVEGLPEVLPGMELAPLFAGAELEEGDVLVVAQKVVSKAEGMLRPLSEVEPSPKALEHAARLGQDPRFVQLVLDQSVRLVRSERVLITETKHGFVCANSGLDHSNVPGEDVVLLLPEDSDRSAAELRQQLSRLTGKEVAVIIADTFGRPFRMGIANIALGVAGLPALVDYRGRKDDEGREMNATVVAVADELAAAAELVMGKTERVPAAIIRGWRSEEPVGVGRDLIRPEHLDLFR